MAQFANSVRDLGGDDDDVSFLDNVDIDGSDYEGNAGAPAEGLTDDVASMWATLSGKGKKIVFDEKAASAPATVDQDKLEREKAKRDKRREKKAEKKAEKAGKTDKAGRTDPAAQAKPAQAKPAQVEKPAAKPATKAKPQKTKFDNETKPERRERPQKSDGPLSKDQVSKGKPSVAIAKLRHPNELVVTENWESYLAPDPEAGGFPIPIDLVESLKEKSRELLNKENDIYQYEQSQSRDFTTSAEFLKSGTFSDQLGTLSILVTNDPLHSMKHLEMLLGKCEIKNRESACKALEVTKDLLVNHVLPDRQLTWFRNQPELSTAPMARLIAMAFEDWLKSYFFRLLQVMERLLSDTVENIRLRALHCIFDFFRLKPEQENNLLRLGLNKLGDSAGKVASRVKKLLHDTLLVHPSMKRIVVVAIDELLGRSSEYHTRYYAVDTLSEFILSNKDPQLANQLVYCYLNLFERLLSEWSIKGDAGRTDKPVQEGKTPRRPLRGKKGGIRQEKKTVDQADEEKNARLVAKIFTGLNRAFPFSRLEPEVFSKYMDTLYRMSHSPNVGTFIEALSFIFQIAKAQQGAGLDRYYRALYESLQDSRLYQSSKLAKYLQLLLRSVSMDSEAPRSAAFAKRMIQTALQWPEVGASAALAYVTAHVPSTNELLEPATGDDEYDMRQRDPKYAKALTSRLWELIPLTQHYHPTVSLYAKNLMTPASERQPLDMPAIDHYSVAAFLSKWSYKKPKEKDNTRGGSIFQPLSGFTDVSLGVRTEAAGTDVPIPVQDWTGRDASSVAPDEQFYFEYFSRKPKPKKEKAPKAEDVDNSDSEAGEEEVFDAIMKTNPDEMGGSDDGLDFSDMDDGSDDDMDALNGAFGSDSDEADGDDAADDDDDADDAEIDEDGEVDGGEIDEIDEVDEDLSGPEFDIDEASDDDADASDDDDKSDKKKRKREWAEYPAFMDADAFEDMYAKKGSSKKTKKSKK